MYPPPTPAPYFPPPPAAPAELYDPVPAAYAAPPGFVAFDPTVPDLAASRFLGSLQHQQPGQVAAPRGSTFSPPPAPHFTPLPPHLPRAAQPYAHAHAQPQPQPQLQQLIAPSQGPPRPPSRAHTIASELHLPPHEAAQVEANLAPIESYSGMQRAHQHARTASDLSYLAQHGADPVRQNSAPAAPQANELNLPSATPPRPCASPVPSIRGDAGRAEVSSPVPARSRVSHTPPPPSPSSHFRRERSPSPSASPSPVESSFSLGVQSGPTALLETIGEDGESQAGNTARSAMLPPGMADALRDEGSGSSPGRSSVQDLEELVEQEERREEERKEREKADKDKKGLPPLPFPTSASTKDARPRAQDIFAPVSQATTPVPAPAPSPSSSSSPTRLAAPKREADGLSALEARLARPSTPDLSALRLSSPSRSPSPIKPLGSPAPHAHVRTLDLGESETVDSALRARRISRASKSEEEVRKAESALPEEAVCRAAAHAEGAQSPAVRAVKAAGEAEAPMREEEHPVQGAPTIADWLKSVEPVPVEEPVMEPLTEPIVRPNKGEAALKTSPPAKYKPLSPLKLAAPAAEPATQEPSSPTSPRRPLPSPPASPHRALPSPPAAVALPSAPRSPSEAKPSTSPALSASPVKPVARPVFSSSPSKRETVPTPEPDMSTAPTAPPRSPLVKASSPSPWSSKPSPWSSVGKPISPVKASAPAPKPTASLDAPRPPIAAVVDDGGRKVVDPVEIKGLKREAVGRIAGWLKDADAEEPVVEAARPESIVSPRTQQSKRVTIDFVRRAPEPPSSSSTSSSPAPASSRARPAAPSPSTSGSATASRRAPPQEPTVAQLLAAETRAAMRQAQADAPAELTRSSAVEKGLNGYLAALKSDAEGESQKDEYAHRSAKRAAPGKVRSVASIWAERVEEADVRVSFGTAVAGSTGVH